MKKNKYPGLFIVVDGLDGSGLSTQTALIRDFFRQAGVNGQTGVNTYLTKEPTDNIIGGLIRGTLSGIYKLQPEAVQLLFSADRSHHLSRKIIPMLEGGNVVVCDRYLWSTVAFGLLKLERKWLLELNKYAILPDISIFLKVSPWECVRRISRDRFDFELFEKTRELTKVWKTYEWLARKFDKKVTIVDGKGEIEEVFERITKVILRNSKAKKIIKKL